MQSEEFSQNDGKTENGRWAIEEHQRFLTGIMQYGKDWKKIQQIVKTRSGAQVRSHAQKFFLKLHKIQKDRKKNKNKNYNQITETESQIMRYINSQEISVNTPVQIINLIKHQTNGKKTVNIEHFMQILQKEKNQLNKNIINQQGKKESSSQNIDQLKKQQVQLTSMQNLLSVYQSCNQYEDDPEESFLVFLVKHNRDHFLKITDFSQLIDFGNNSKNHQQPSQYSKRKRSFTVYEDQDNDQRLKETLDIMRKVMKTDNQSS